MMLSSSSNETVVAVQIMFITLQNTFEIRENKTKAKYEICSKLTIKTAEWDIKPRYCIFCLNFEHMFF